MSFKKFLGLDGFTPSFPGEKPAAQQADIFGFARELSAADARLKSETSLGITTGRNEEGEIEYFLNGHKIK